MRFLAAPRLGMTMINGITKWRGLTEPAELQEPACRAIVINYNELSLRA